MIRKHNRNPRRARPSDGCDASAARRDPGRRSRDFQGTRRAVGVIPSQAASDHRPCIAPDILSAISVDRRVRASMARSFETMETSNRDQATWLARGAALGTLVGHLLQRPTRRRRSATRSRSRSQSAAHEAVALIPVVDRAIPRTPDPVPQQDEASARVNRASPVVY